MRESAVELNKALARELVFLDGKANGGTSSMRPEKLVACAAVAPGTLRKAVDVYHGPAGKGVVLRLIYEEGGKRWIRTLARGPQAFKNSDWKALSTPQQR